MASMSVSLRKAQVPLSCHFCNEQAVQWKCEECDVFMCTSCKEKIHQRLKSAQDHEIVSISDISKENFSQRDVASEVISSVFNTYTTAVPVITSLSCSGDEDVYFTCNKPQERSQLVKGKMLKSSIRTLETLEKIIFDIAVTKDGETFFNDIGYKEVRILTHAGEIKTVVDTSPMIPLSLHVNKDNELIVGLREHGPPFPTTDFSIRQVMIVGKDYKRKVSLETDTKGKKLFSYPARVKTDSTNVLYVSDWFNADHSGRVVAVEANGRLKFTYYGNQTCKTFCPFGISITPSDNIILSDKDSNALHVLNTKGELLGLHFIDKDCKIKRPLSLCIDNEGYLLIGNAPIQDKKDSNANIYVTKIIEHFM
ncbi:tripartite motif-containing protein 2-like [Mytilus edulis]|uniref:tripartite motif-containing protein 2-like n=1 Tax=Mytilus edulis TaxID=6550 RepID=UPI0039EF0110